MKKFFLVITMLFFIQTTFALDLDGLGSDTTSSGTDSSQSTSSGADSNIKIVGLSNKENEKKVSKIQIVTETPTIEADGKKTISVIVQVSDDSNNPLTDADVDLKADIIGNDSSNSLGIFNTGAYSRDDKYFKFSYTAGTKPGEVQLKVTATSKTNKENEVSQIEKIVLTESTSTKQSSNSSDNSNQNQTNLSGLDDKGFKDHEEVDNKVNNKSDIHVLKVKVLDGNRVKIFFDNEIALSDSPLDMVTIESVKDKTKINVSNVTLGEDKKSLIVFLADGLKKEEYHVIVNSVVDGKTMKSVSVINGNVTVSGIEDVAIILFGLILSIGYIFFLRKRVYKFL